MKNCPVTWVLNTLSKRWILHILNSMSIWNKWFNDIKRSILWISPKILSERLTDLENEWYIKREIVNQKPIRVEYIFTRKWESLEEVMKFISSWVLKNDSLYNDTSI